jgi:hypothetical protein
MPQFLDRNAKTERHRQTFHIHVMHAGGELRTDSNLMSNERPLWVKSGHDGVNFRCVLYPRKRTSRTASRQIALASFVDNTLQTIQWFSHGIFVLRPHFLRHRAVWLLHVPRMGSQLGETRPRHTLSSGPLFFSDGKKKSPGSFLSRPGDSPQSLNLSRRPAL